MNMKVLHSFKKNLYILPEQTASHSRRRW